MPYLCSFKVQRSCHVLIKAGQVCSLKRSPHIMLSIALLHHHHMTSVIFCCLSLYIRSHIPLPAEVDWEKKLTDISMKIDGFSGREISKLVIAWQVHVHTSTCVCVHVCNIHHKSKDRFQHAHTCTYMYHWLATPLDSACVQTRVE